MSHKAAVYTVKVRQKRDRSGQYRLLGDIDEGALPVVLSSVMARIHQKAQQFRDADPSLTREQAESMLLEREPELYSEYLQAKQRDQQPFRAAETQPVSGTQRFELAPPAQYGTADWFKQFEAEELLRWMNTGLTAEQARARLYGK